MQYNTIHVTYYYLNISYQCIGLFEKKLVFPQEVRCNTVADCLQSCLDNGPFCLACVSQIETA